MKRYMLLAGERAIWTKTTIRHQVYSPLQRAYPFPLEHQTEAIEYGYVVSGLYHITDDLDAGLVYPSRVREDSGGTSSGWPNHSYGMDARVTLPDWLEGGLNDTLASFTLTVGCNFLLMEPSQSEALHSTLETVYFDHCYAHMVSVSLGANV